MQEHEYQYWAHKRSGETYAVWIIDGRAAWICGPLYYRDVLKHEPDEYNFDDRFTGNPDDYRLTELPDSPEIIELPGDLHQIQEEAWDANTNYQVPAEFVGDSDIETAVDEYLAHYAEMCGNEPPIYKITLTGSRFTLRDLMIGYLERQLA